MKTYKFSEEEHKYYADDIELPSVTTVIGEWKFLSLSMMYYNIFSGTAVNSEAFLKAREFGKAVHKAFKIMLTSTLDFSVISPLLVNPCQQFQKWCQDYKVKPLEIETPLYSDIDGYAGTPDIIHTMMADANTIHITDVKTGEKNAMVGVQTAAYERLARRCLEIRKTIQRHELILGEGNYKFRELNNKDDLTFFLARLYQYNFLT